MEHNIFLWAETTEHVEQIVPTFARWLISCPTLERLGLLHERFSQEALGVIQRGVFEELMRSPDGTERDLVGFAHRFDQLPQDFAQEFFGQHYQGVLDIANTARVLGSERSK